MIAKQTNPAQDSSKISVEHQRPAINDPVMITISPPIPIIGQW